MKKVLLLITVLTACGPDTTVRTLPKNIYRPLAVYVDRFEQLYHIEIVGNYSMILADLGSEATGIVGECDTETKRMRFDRVYWNEANDQQREVVVFHELGHCVLNRPHTKASIAGPNNTAVPASIMYPQVLDTDLYKKNRDYYCQELIANKQSFNLTAEEETQEEEICQREKIQN